MRKSSVLRTLSMRHPQLFQQMLEWKRAGMQVRAIARQVEQNHGVTISLSALYHYIWRYERLTDDTNGFWTPERIRGFPAEFVRSMNAYAYAHMHARYAPKVDARRYVLGVVRAMCERVLEQERGGLVPPLSTRAVGYRGFEPVPTTILRKLRLERELTLDELARRARVGKYTLTKWERYGVVPNSLHSIVRIADALGVPIPTLLHDYAAYGRIDRKPHLFIETDRDAFLEGRDSSLDHSDTASALL